MIASTAGDKAKYKEKLKDWIVAFCLLFFMHYIMAGTITIVEKINNMLATNAGVTEGLDINSEYGSVKYNPKGGTTSYNPSYTDNFQSDKIEKIINDWANTYGWRIKEDESGFNQIGNASGDGISWHIQLNNNTAFSINYTRSTGMYTIQRGNLKNEADTNYLINRIRNEVGTINSVNTSGSVVSESGSTQIIETNEGAVKVKSGSGHEVWVAKESIEGGSKVLFFTNYARLFLNSQGNDKTLPVETAYLVIYIALVAFTAVFTFRYIKRVIYIAFLTLIAPLVALTYPLDKVRRWKGASMGCMV